jgi:hypothetical protein
VTARTNWLLLTFALLVYPTTTAAQTPIASPMIAGVPVSCPVGAVMVPTVVTANVPGGDIAFSTFINGQPVILLSPNLASYPPAIQLFTYGHECAHHKLLHAIGTVTIDMEVKADCWSIQRMAQQGMADAATAQLIASFFYPNPGKPPMYPPGPMRAQNILSCFQSMSPAGGG